MKWRTNWEPICTNGEVKSDGEPICIKKRHHSSFVFTCSKMRVHEIFLKPKLQIMWLKTSILVLGFTKYFLTFSALQTLVPPNLRLLLRLS